MTIKVCVSVPPKTVDEAFVLIEKYISGEKMRTAWYLGKKIGLLLKPAPFLKVIKSSTEIMNVHSSFWE